MYAVTAKDFTATGTADILLHDYIRHCGYPKRLLFDNSPLCSYFLDEFHKPLGIRKIATSSITLTIMVALKELTTPWLKCSTVVDNLQNNWYLHLSHVMLYYNNSVDTTTGLFPNELHLGRYPRFPITVFERHTFDGHKG